MLWVPYVNGDGAGVGVVGVDRGHVLAFWVQDNRGSDCLGCFGLAYLFVHGLGSLLSVKGLCGVRGFKAVMLGKLCSHAAFVVVDYLRGFGVVNPGDGLTVEVVDKFG